MYKDTKGRFVASYGIPRRRKYFSSEKDAIRFEKGCYDGFDRLSKRAKLELLLAYERANEQGVSLLDLIAESPQKKISVKAAAYEYVSSKYGRGLRPKSISDVKDKIRPLVTHVGESNVGDVKPGDIKAALTSYSGTSFNSYRVGIGTFFNWCVKREYCKKNPMELVDKATVSTKPIEIFTVDQTRELLQAAKKVDPKLLPYFCLGLFAGIRTAELARLTWDDVGETHVEIKAENAKTRARRIIDLQPNLKEWLKLGGDLTSVNLRRRMTRIKSHLSFKWPKNGMRHSFASYLLAKTKNADLVAHQLGHGSTQMLFQHYRELVTEEAGKKYFEIV